MNLAFTKTNVSQVTAQPPLESMYFDTQVPNPKSYDIPANQPFAKYFVLFQLLFLSPPIFSPFFFFFFFLSPSFYPSLSIQLDNLQCPALLRVATAIPRVAIARPAAAAFTKRATLAAPALFEERSSVLFPRRRVLRGVHPEVSTITIYAQLHFDAGNVISQLLYNTRECRC